MERRAISPVLGTGLLVALTVLLAATMGTVLLEAGAQSEAATVRLGATADAAADRIELTHEGGGTVDPDGLEIRVRIEGEALDRQPPVPFFAADGFVSGPRGPFNSATAGDWAAGETGSFRIASTNTPRIEAGDRVEVTVLVDGDLVGSVETTAD